jgi:hypothetical protein
VIFIFSIFFFFKSGFGNLSKIFHKVICFLCVFSGFKNSQVSHHSQAINLCLDCGAPKSHEFNISQFFQTFNAISKGFFQIDSAHFHKLSLSNEYSSST